MRRVVILLSLSLLLILTTAPPSSAGGVQAGGYLKGKNFFFVPRRNDVTSLVRDDGGVDALLEGRMTVDGFAGPHVSYSLHYDFTASTRESLRRGERVREGYPFLSFPVSGGNAPSRLFDLEKEVDESGTFRFFHEIDRARFTWSGPRVSFTLGRDAEAWGRGFLFSPFDLLNPFPPDEVDREYRRGVDLARVSVSFPGGESLRAVLIPRRDGKTGEVLTRLFTSGALLTLGVGGSEVDLVFLRHFEDLVAGGSASTYLGDAALRCEVAFTLLPPGEERKGYLSFLVNADRSWVFGEKNWYGFVEYYHNGGGVRNPSDLLNDPVASERFLRGDFPVMGRDYLGGGVQVEIHPLYNQFLTVVVDLKGPSGFFQIHGVYDAAENVQITWGATIYGGADGTEFGGVPLPGSPLLLKPPQTFFLWVSRYF